MQIQYVILWIDDEMERFESVGDLDRINSYLLDLGFTPTIRTLKDGRNINNELDNYKFDLIISDYNIEDGHHGDDLIKQIRERGIFTEVLFYSSQTDLNSIALKLLTVDRISFHSGRRELMEKIETLIGLTVSKLFELTATRGLITSETSDLDVVIEELVMDLVYNKLKLPQADIDGIINHYVDDLLKPSPDTFLKKYKELGFEKWFYRMEANRKWSIFRDLLKKLGGENVIAFLKINKTYGTDVIGIRNKFAHAKAIEQNGKLYLAGLGPDGDKFEFDTDQCISIRKNLITHRENLIGLKVFLAS